MKDEKKPMKKAPYQAPVLKRIDLHAEEVLGSGCKVAGAGPAQPVCASCTTDTGS